MTRSAGLLLGLTAACTTRDDPIWLLDGAPIKETHYEWRAPPANLLVTNQIGMTLPGANLAGMQANESQWNYVIDYIRIWRPAP